MKKLLLVPICILLLAAMLIGGCGEPEETTQPTSTQPTSTQPTSTQPTTTTPVTGQPQYGGTLRVSYNGEPVTLGDPRGDHAWGVVMGLCAMEGLVRQDTSGVLQPYLAESWQTDADAPSLTVKLKKGIKFHDGTDFNAEAVKFTWELFEASQMMETKTVTSIDIIDEYTVRANLDEWDNSITVKLLFTAGRATSPAAWEEMGEDVAKKTPVGTGPFKFVSWTPEVGAQFVKFDGYWQEGMPYLDAVEFIFISDATTQEASFRAGECDVINCNALQAKNLEEEPDKYIIYHDKTGLDSGFFQLFPDVGTDTPTMWADVKLRQAVAYAIDTQALIDSTQYGYATATNQWGVSTNWAWSPNVKGYPYNPEKAMELMEEAGYPDGFDTSVMGFSFMEDMLEAIQGMLAKVNINAEIRAMAPPAEYEYIIHGGWEGLMAAPRRPDGHIPYRMSIHYSTDALEGPGVYHSVELDARMAEVLKAKTFEEQQALAWELQEYVYDELCVAIPLFMQDGMAAKHIYVHDDGFGTAGRAFWTPETAWLEQ